MARRIVVAPTVPRYGYPGFRADLIDALVRDRANPDIDPRISHVTDEKRRVVLTRDATKLAKKQATAALRELRSDKDVVLHRWGSFSSFPETWETFSAVVKPIRGATYLTLRGDELIPVQDGC